MSYSATKIRTPTDILRHIKQRLRHEGELSEPAEKIFDEYIDEEEKYISTILRNKKDWKPLPERSPEELKVLELTAKKANEYKLYCEELGQHPTPDQLKKKNDLNEELQQLMDKLYPQD